MTTTDNPPVAHCYRTDCGRPLRDGDTAWEVPITEVQVRGDRVTTRDRRFVCDPCYTGAGPAGPGSEGTGGEQ